MDNKAHWEQVYRTKPSETLSWHQGVPTRSLELIDETPTLKKGAIIDIGGGDSTLVDELLGRDIGPVTVLDISGAALARARARLGTRAERVTWIEGDVTRTPLPDDAYDLWHDRAVFHFLTDEADRRQYAEVAARALRPGGTAIIATFALDGPTRCSGLEILRYSPETLATALGAQFELLHGFGDVHRTPSGGEQRFTYAVFRLGSAR